MDLTWVYCRLSSKLDTASRTVQPRSAICCRKLSMAATQNGEIRLSKRSAMVRRGVEFTTLGTSATALNTFKKLRLSVVIYYSSRYDGIPTFAPQSPSNSY